MTEIDVFVTLYYTTQCPLGTEWLDHRKRLCSVAVLICVTKTIEKKVCIWSV